MSKWNGMVYKFIQEANNMLSDTELHALLNVQIMEQGRLLDLAASETLEKTLKTSQ